MSLSNVVMYKFDRSGSKFPSDWSVDVVDVLPT